MNNTKKIGNSIAIGAALTIISIIGLVWVFSHKASSSLEARVGSQYTNEIYLYGPSFYIPLAVLLIVGAVGLYKIIKSLKQET